MLRRRRSGDSSLAADAFSSETLPQSQYFPSACTDGYQSTPSTKEMLIGELEKELRLEQRRRHSSCSPRPGGVAPKGSKESKTSGSKSQPEGLEKKVADNWRSQRSSETRRVMIEALERKLRQEQDLSNSAQPCGKSESSKSPTEQGAGHAEDAKTATGRHAAFCSRECATLPNKQVGMMAGQMVPRCAAPGGAAGSKKTAHPGIAEVGDVAFASLVPDGRRQREPASSGAKESLAVDAKEKRCLERLRDVMSFCAGGFRSSKSRFSPQ